MLLCIDRTGLTVAGLFRIFTGFPINRVAANQNVMQSYNFFMIISKKNIKFRVLLSLML